MDFILDIGNTHSKAAVFLNDGIHKKYVFAEGGLNLNELSEEFTPDRILVSSSSGFLPVMPRKWNNSAVKIFDSDTPVPIINAYRTPETLGRDRLAAAVGSAWLYPNRAVLSIDLGTCITYDFITENKEYLGGSISPGMNMRFKAMHHFTGKLPLVEPAEETSLPGTDTLQSMQSGVQKGIIFEIEGQIRHYRDKYPQTLVILTGGDARYFVNRLKYEIFANQNLVLIGLHQILKHNDL